MHLFRKKPVHRHTWVWVVFFILLFLLVLRMILPSIMVMYANDRLKNESPNFTFVIDDIDLHILRGQYTVEGITGNLKPNGERFLTISSVVVDVPWNNIFDGKIVTDVIVNRMNVTASQPVLDKARAEGERLKSKAENKFRQDSPITVKTFSLNDSIVTIKDLLSFKGNETRTISHINVLASNLTPTDKKPVTSFVMTANVFGPAPLKVGGIATLKTDPPQWDVNSELKKFDLTTMNPLLKEKARASIKQGKMDFYAEAKSEKGKVEGYVKPFVSKLSMTTPKGGFNFKGRAAQTGDRLVKTLLGQSENKTLATFFPFSADGKLHYDVIAPLKLAVEDQIKSQVKPGIENKINLENVEPGHGVREAQEEMPKGNTRN